MSGSSPSMGPEDPNEFNIPDDAVVVQYPKLDPADVLEDPSLIYGDERKNFYDQPMDEKLGSQLVELAETYGELSHASLDISLAILKHKLQENALKHSEAYEVLDKFYNDYPDTFPIPGSFLGEEHLPLFAKKLTLHNKCQGLLKAFGETMENVKSEVTDNIEPSESEEMSSDEEVPVQKRSKKKKQKKKGKKNKD